MKYPRIEHSACTILDRYMVIMGSQVTHAKAKVECYDIKKDEWTELPELAGGRHGHGSCQFKNKFIYTFGGIDT